MYGSAQWNSWRSIAETEIRLIYSIRVECCYGSKINKLVWEKDGGKLQGLTEVTCM